jgi:N-acetylglucosaminyl-diphospho-decaprenol L-rhamnosyltransferase
MTYLSIIIVNWNTSAVLAECLRSIAVFHKHENIEIFVIDNASTDDSVAMLAHDFPSVSVIQSTENIGFASANNLGIHASTGEFVLLLNPDTLFIDESLNRMITFLQDHPSVGIVAPHTLNADRSTQSSKRRFPTLTSAVFESTWLQPYAPQSLMNNYFANDIAEHATAEIDWAQGSCLLVRRTVFSCIGGLDEGFFMYSEEMDFCYRAKRAGFQVIYMGVAHIVHLGGKSSEQAPAATMIRFHESKIRFFRIYHGYATASVLYGVIVLNFGVQIVLEAIKALLGHKAEMRKQRVRRYLTVLSTLRIR